MDTPLAVDPVGQLSQRLAEAEQQLALLKEQLTQSQRLATIGTIAAVIAHEFNNILTPVISYSQFALQSAEGDNPDLPLIRKALAKSYNGSTKAGKVCASLLGLVRGESEHAPVTVQQLVDETLSVMARDPQKDGVSLRVHIQSDLQVHGDAVQLEQVLLNLLINAQQAIAAAGRGGSVTIKASSESAGERVVLTIADTGPGIAEKNLSRVFEPFFTTKGTARKGENRGTGLGLAICREIIEAHKGTINVASETGRGTVFTIVLPRAPKTE